jgi:hypothetical protein
MKSGARFIAIASGPIQDRKRALLVGVVAREDKIEGILSGSVAVNGDDATRRITLMISRTRFKEQIRIVALNGVAIAGLNVIDVQRLERELGVETIVFTRAKPDPRKLVHALGAFAGKNGMDAKDRIALVRAQAKRKPESVDGFHIQCLLKKYELSAYTKQSYEMLRIAHLIASGIETGESRGRL